LTAFLVILFSSFVNKKQYNKIDLPLKKIKKLIGLGIATYALIYVSSYLLAGAHVHRRRKDYCISNRLPEC